MLIKLFTTTTCPKCPDAHCFMKDNKIEYEPIIVDKHSEGMELATKYEVSSVPSVVVSDKDGTHRTMPFAEFKSFYLAINSHPKLMEAIGKL